MELMFRKTEYPCLQQVKWEVQTQEQTQELRIEDGLPDVGRVIGAWGQVVLRGKEWRSDEMRISAGVMVWVLYAPEDGSGEQCVETWIPLQLKWTLPYQERDGKILASCLLQGVDARSISARRLMVRASVSVLGEAVCPGVMAAYTPEEVPEGVQLSKKRYPMELCCEAGEKPFVLEEELSLPAGSGLPEKWIYYRLQPEIIDQKVLAGKVVFRGIALLHTLYKSEDGTLCSFDAEYPFSQYAELEKDYDQDATARIVPAVTAMELTRDEEGKWLLKAGLTGQYVICHRPVVEVVEDAYGIARQVTPVTEGMSVASVLDRDSQVVTAEQTVQMDADQIIDVCFLPEQGSLVRNDGSVDIRIPGCHRLLYTDPEGRLQTTEIRWEEIWDLPAGDSSRIMASVLPSGKPQATVNGGSITLRGDLLIDALTTGQTGMQQVRGLEVGEEIAPDPNRPSLILQRFTEHCLWDMAKELGTTVDAILAANGLTEEPRQGQMLLIPIA